MYSESLRSGVIEAKQFAKDNDYGKLVTTYYIQNNNIYLRLKFERGEIEIIANRK